MQTNSWVALLAIALLGGSGCYLGHLARGQASLIWSKRPIADVLGDPDTPPDVRERLALVQEARAFADRLGLRVGGQYTSYAHWPGDRLVTALVATRPGEVEPRGFWFPIVGRVPYKGFFDVDAARNEADGLRETGHDVCLVAVPAYSTLGWLDDPVTTPMLLLGEGRLVETILHELVHATVFVESQAEFNEGIATFIGQEASVRFFVERDGAGSDEAREQRLRVEDERRIARALGSLRSQVADLYSGRASEPARAAERDRLEVQARAELARLPLRTRDAPRYAETLRLNDACLALSATYEGELAAYEERLRELDEDLRAFITAARAASEQSDPRSVLLGPTRSVVTP